jgi:hypothetical protein
MAEFKETRRKPGTQKKHNTSQNRRRRQPLSCDKLVRELEHETYRNQPKVYNILKHISKDLNEAARIQGNID